MLKEALSLRLQYLRLLVDRVQASSLDIGRDPIPRVFQRIPHLCEVRCMAILLMSLTVLLAMRVMRVGSVTRIRVTPAC